MKGIFPALCFIIIFALFQLKKQTNIFVPFKQLHFTLQILISCWFPGAIMAPTVLQVNYSHFIPNFSSSPPLLLPLSLLLPLHVQCHCVSKCLCVGNPSDLACLCVGVTSLPTWTFWAPLWHHHWAAVNQVKATSLIVSKVYRWSQTHKLALTNEEAHGLIGSAERWPRVGAPIVSSLEQTSNC